MPFRFKKVKDEMKNKFIYKTVIVTMQADRKNKSTTITPEEVIELYDDVVRQARREHKQFKIMVRALSNARMFTLKGYDQDDLNIKTTQDYFQGKVKNPNADKLANFNQVIFSIVLPTKVKRIV